MPDTKNGHIHWGSWDFDFDVSGFEGLSLLNGTYRGRTAIGKFSMPVIRVKYLEDGGPLDWKRAIGKGAGPYADRLRWKLGGLYGLQRISNRNNEYVGLASYIRNGVQWLELSIYGRIGAYHLSQQWHLSEDGWIAPRIWSKGLTINMDHWHHPYWRLDFDIDGTGPNRVFVRKFGAWSDYKSEVNDVKDGDPRANTRWFVRNEKTFQGAWIIPSTRDGEANSFSTLDVGVRRFVNSEETSPWLYTQGPTSPGPFGVPLPIPTWDWQFDTGELGFLNGEDVNGTDVVLWYVSHMFHHAHEGSDHWGWSGPWIKLHYDAPPPPRPQGFGIFVDIDRHQTGNDTTVKGRGFTPGGSVKVTMVGIPNKNPIERFRTADAQGRFELTEPFGFTSRNRDDAFGTVEIFAFDVTTGLMDKWFGNAAPWVAP